MINCNLKILSEISNLYPIDNLKADTMLSDYQVISFFEKLRLADHICFIFNIQQSVYCEFSVQKKSFIFSFLLGDDLFYKHGFNLHYFSGKVFKSNESYFKIHDLFDLLSREHESYDLELLLRQYSCSYVAFDFTNNLKINQKQFLSLQNNFEKALSSIYSYKILERSKIALFGILPDYLKRNLLTKVISDYFGNNTEFLSNIKVYSDIHQLIANNNIYLYSDYELSDYKKKNEELLNRVNELTYSTNLKKNYFFN